jgi:hypothetical protein
MILIPIFFSRSGCLGGFTDAELREWDDHVHSKIAPRAKQLAEAVTKNNALLRRLKAR